MREYVVIYGNARVTEGAAVPLLQRRAPIYLGPKADYPPASMPNIAVMSQGSRRQASLGLVRGSARMRHRRHSPEPMIERIGAAMQCVGAVIGNEVIGLAI
jgi:hypothetical protein